MSFAAGQKIKAGTTTQYDVIGQDGVKLFDCFIDLKWRAKRPKCLEFAVLGLKEGRKGVALMLLDNVDGVYYRVNWEWKLSQHLRVATWVCQDPVQKLIVLG